MYIHVHVHLCIVDIYMYMHLHDVHVHVHLCIVDIYMYIYMHMYLHNVHVHVHWITHITRVATESFNLRNIFSGEERSYLFTEYYHMISNHNCLERSRSVILSLWRETSVSSYNLYVVWIIRIGTSVTIATIILTWTRSPGLHASTRSPSRIISTERGSWPAGAFSGISWTLIVWWSRYVESPYSVSNGLPSSSCYDIGHFVYWILNGDVSFYSSTHVPIHPSLYNTCTIHVQCIIHELYMQNTCTIYVQCTIHV